MASSKGDDNAPPSSFSTSASTHDHQHPRPPVPSQLSSDLPGTTTYLTGHDAASGSGQAVVHSTRPASWKAFDGGAMGFNQIYTNRFPADLNGDGDIAFHDAMVGSGAMGLATKGGVVCRMVDLGPLYECMSKYVPTLHMHEPTTCLPKSKVLCFVVTCLPVRFYCMFGKEEKR